MTQFFKNSLSSIRVSIAEQWTFEISWQLYPYIILGFNKINVGFLLTNKIKKNGTNYNYYRISSLSIGSVISFFILKM